MLPLAAATAMLILYLTLDLEALRNDLEAEIGALTGRAVAIDGDLKLVPSLNPTVVAEHVALGNADWGSQRTMLNIGRLRGQVALLPLLSGDIRIRHIEFTDTELLLETDPRGRGNWLLGSTGNADPVGPTPVPVIDRVSFSNLRLIWRDGDSGELTTFALGRLNLTGIGSAGSIQVKAESHAEADSAQLAWNFRLNLAATATGYAIHGLSLSAGETDVSGNLDIVMADGRPQLTGRLTSRLLRPTDLARISADPERIGPPTDVRVNRNERFFSQTPFGIRIPSSLGADLVFEIQRLDTPPLAFVNLSAQILADNGILSTDNVKADLDGSRLSAALVLDTTRERPLARLRLRGEDIRTGKVMRALTGRHWLDSLGDLHVEVQGRGRSMAEIMSNLSGTARLMIGKGDLDAQELDAMIGGLNVALKTLTDQGADRTRLNCIASSFTIDKGIATSQLFLADTEFSTVYGEGKIDFRSERLGLILKPKPKTLSLNVAVPVEIGGTLTSPTFTPEKFATARKGAGLLAAVGVVSFPPAILLGLGELGSGDANPCLKAAATASRGHAGNKRPNNPEPGLLDRTTENVNTALDNIGSALKGLFN